MTDEKISKFEYRLIELMRRNKRFSDLLFEILENYQEATFGKDTKKVETAVEKEGNEV